MKKDGQVQSTTKQLNYVPYVPKALQYYLKAIEINPNYALAYRNLGDYYTTQKEYAKAQEMYQRASEVK